MPITWSCWRRLIAERNRTPSLQPIQATWERKTVLALACLNLVAVAFYVVVAVRMGFFRHMEATLFSSPDSTVYRDVANWLWGSGPNTFESQRRPFLFPFLLG